MFRFKSLVALGVLGACAVTSALAGAGDVVADVVALSTPVTYSNPAAVPPLVTYVGYTVRVSNTTPNTINSMSITFSLKANDTAPAYPATELIVEASQLPAGCEKAADNTSIVCTIGTLRGNTSFPATGDPLFVAFYKSPVAASGVTKLTTNVHVVYAEGVNGGNPAGNSSIDIGQVSVDLGTANSVSIKSALPKSGGALRTGSAAIPDTSNVATEAATVPPGLLPGYTTAAIGVALAATPNCISQGRFVSCPAFTTSLRDEAGNLRLFSTASPLTLTYRVHPSNLKMSAAKVLNSVLITYTPDGGSAVPVQDICPSKTSATGTGTPCIASAFCYKQNTPGWTLALDGVCEWNFNNTRNGLLKLD